jgi:sugar/nucleoside kinase (ribokinase family)
MMARSVLAIGEVGVDWLIRVPALPSRGGNAWGPAPERHGGGATANVAVGLARLDVPVAFCGKVGDDEPGRFLREDLRREGVETALLRVAPETFTQVVVAIIEADGERTFLVCSQGAAHTRLRPDEIDPDAIASASWLHTSGTCLAESPTREAVLHAMTLAGEFHVPVSLDVNVRFKDIIGSASFCAAVQKALSSADVVLGSAEELVPFAPAASIEASARALAGKDRTVIVRLGPDGALAASSAGVLIAAAFPTPVVDTVGAGDAFDAGFIAARLTGLDVETALRWGNAVAALKIARPGARSLPSRREVEGLVNG